MGLPRGTIERLLETSVEYAHSRAQFGQPIGKFQGSQDRRNESAARGGPTDDVPDCVAFRTTAHFARRINDETVRECAVERAPRDVDWIDDLLA